MSSDIDTPRFLYHVEEGYVSRREAKDHGFDCYVTIMEAAHFHAGGRFSDHEVMDKIIVDCGDVGEVYHPSRFLTELAAGSFGANLDPDALRHYLNMLGTFAEADLFARRATSFS